MSERPIRPKILATWVVVLAAGFAATPTAGAAHQNASGGEPNRWFWAVVGIVVTLVLGVWLLSLLMVIFGPPIVWIRDHLDEHLAKHPPRITMDQNFRRR